MQKTVLITGGTGMIGERLSQLLLEKGCIVRHLSRRRNVNAEFQTFFWDYEATEIDADALDGVHYVVHLAGANVAGSRWTNAYKKEIIDSRTKTTALLERVIEQQIREKTSKLEAFISASAVGIYGDTGSKIADETSEIGTTFLAKVCSAWEDSVQNITNLTVRTVVLRIGIVLSTKGGALQKLLPTYRVGVGTYFGNGSLFTPWIHIDDLCSMLIIAMENKNYTGIYNAVSPTMTTGKNLAKAVAIALNKPNSILIGVPKFILNLAMGEMSSMLFENSRVLPTRTIATGFQWKYADLAKAIEHLLENKT